MPINQHFKKRVIKCFVAFAANIVAAIWHMPNHPQTTRKGSFCKAKAMII